MLRTVSKAVAVGTGWTYVENSENEWQTQSKHDPKLKDCWRHDNSCGEDEGQFLDCTTKNIHYILVSKSFQHENFFSWPSEEKLIRLIKQLTNSGWEVRSLFWKMGFQLSHLSTFMFWFNKIVHEREVSCANHGICEIVPIKVKASR